MKSLRISALLFLAFASLVLCPLLGEPTLAVAQPASPTLLQARSVIINELMPAPEGDDPEWLELLNMSRSSWVFLPLVMRNYRPGGGSLDGPRLLATGDGVASPGTGLDLSGWQIGDEDGNVYTIPDALGPVPPGAYVLILFDGQGSGSDDYDLGDGQATLHTPSGLVGIFDDRTDQAALYTGSTHNASTLHDFVAYGALPGTDGDAAATANLWSPELYVGDTEPVPGAQVLQPGGSLGLLPGRREEGLDDWTLYLPGEKTPGAENATPAPYFRTPPDGIETTDRRIPFGWSTVDGAANYQFRLASDAGFASVVIDQEVTDASYIPDRDLSDGTYYYRARARNPDGSNSDYSPTHRVTIISVAASSRPEEKYWLNVDPQLQHKDSRMICVDGHHRTGNDRWDSAHEDDGDWQVGNGKALRTNDHDNWYCTRAAIAMIVDYHGGALSQDRISYHKYDGGTPEGDLGHGKGLWPDKRCTWKTGDVGDDDVLSWAMNGGKIDCGRGKPSFNKIKGWIDAERPVLLVELHPDSKHSVVVDGYSTEGEMVRRVDPWTATISWIKYSTWKIDEYLCPLGDETPRSNEEEFYADSDGDGIIDFDEINRLATSYLRADSDNDWVYDKWDLHEVYYGTSGRRANRLDGPDMDGDGFRKEEDEDNDGGGAIDGCEDANQNGRNDPGETHNFFADDDVPCIPTVDDVYTTDYDEKLKASFRPGEAIVLVIKATNHTAESKAAKLSWDTRGPGGQSVPYLSLPDRVDSLEPGTDTIWIDRAIAKGATPGTYTYEGSLTYLDRKRFGVATFTVGGTPISMGLARALTCRDVREDNLFVGKTDTFTPSDEKAVVWTAWQGAWGQHTVKFEWYLPSGAFYFDYSHSVSSTEALYKAWSWAEGAALWQTGLWKVKIYLDDTYVDTVGFTVKSTGQAMPAMAPQGTAVGGGGHGMEPP